MSGSPRKAALELRSHEVTALAADGSGKSGLDNFADMQELDDPPHPIAASARQFPRQRSSQLQEHQVHRLWRNLQELSSQRHGHQRARQEQIDEFGQIGIAAAFIGHTVHELLSEDQSLLLPKPLRLRPRALGDNLLPLLRGGVIARWDCPPCARPSPRRPWHRPGTATWPSNVAISLSAAIDNSVLQPCAMVHIAPASLAKELPWRAAREGH